MRPFDFQPRTRVVFREGGLSLIGTLARSLEFTRTLLVADRGIHSQEATTTWSAICRQIEAACGRSEFEAGAAAGIDAVAQSLRRHFPRRGPHANELPDEPVLL